MVIIVLAYTSAACSLTAEAFVLFLDKKNHKLSVSDLMNTYNK